MLAYHSETDSLCIDLLEQASVESREISEVVVFDVDADRSPSRCRSSPPELCISVRVEHGTPNPVHRASMLRLVAFGSSSLERDGERLAGLSGQRKAMALLALLAHAGSAGSSREKLMALLWSESDDTHARNALKQLVHAVRQQLGAPDALAGTGDLRLDPAFIASDIAEFDRACLARSFEDAVTLYRGPFLDGFYVRDADEFERWMERTRAEYHARYLEALESLASEADRAGDRRTAVKWWSRLASADPLSAGWTLRLMEALHAAGEPAAALRHARTHELLVREELAVPPDPRVAALAESIEHTSAPAEPSLVSAHVAPVATDDGQATSAAPVSVAPTSISSHDVVSPPATRWARTRRRDLVLPMLALVLSVGALGYWIRARDGAAAAADPSAAAAARTAPGTARTSGTTPSVGVMPFANTSGNAENDPFSDGLTDELISTLASMPGLKVSGRTSAFGLKGSGLGVRGIADTLHVATVVEGSVRREGDRLRITAQLVRAMNDSVLWTGTFDRHVRDAFAVQEEIARSIATALQVKLREPAQPGRSHTTADLRAYDLYLKGRYFSLQQTRDGSERAIAYFEQAIARDTSYARAYAGLADARVISAVFGNRPTTEELPKARASALRALVLDSSLGEAHAALAHVLFAFDWNWPEAGREFQRAIALEPNSSTSRLRYGVYLLDLGRFGDAVEQLTQADSIDPLSAPIAMTLGRVFVNARQPDQAIRHLDDAVELNPRLAFAHQQLGHAYLQKRMPARAVDSFERAAQLGGVGDSAQLAYAYAVTGSRDRAVALLGRLVETGTTRPLPPFAMALGYVGLGDRDHALDWLERGVAEHAAYMDLLGVSPAFDPLRGDARFLALLRRVNLAR